MSAQSGRATRFYPLRLEPIYEYRPWGGRRLGSLLGGLSPGEGRIGEAWVLSDRAEYQSRVIEGPLEGLTLRQLMERFGSSSSERRRVGSGGSRCC